MEMMQALQEYIKPELLVLVPLMPSSMYPGM